MLSTMQVQHTFWPSPACLALALGSAAQAQTLRIAMTASDVPTVGGIPDNGSEGYRFAGYPIYDALVNWDFTKPQEIADLTPGLATSWEANKDDPRRWVFTLRKGVKFHDGTDFTADSVIWNFDRIFNDKAPHYDSAQAADRQGVAADARQVREARRRPDRDHDEEAVQPVSLPDHARAVRVARRSSPRSAATGWRSARSRPAPARSRSPR